MLSLRILHILPTLSISYLSFPRYMTTTHHKKSMKSNKHKDNSFNVKDNEILKKMIPVTKKIRELQDINLFEDQIKLPVWKELSLPPISRTKGENIMVMKDYPKLSTWVKSKMDKAVTDYIKDRCVDTLLLAIDRVRQKILDSIESIAKRRHSTFPNAKSRKTSKFNSRKGIYWRCNLATRRIKQIKPTSTDFKVQSALNDLVLIRDMERSF